MAQQAQINGKVEYREGDGANILIRPGPVQVEKTAQDVTLSWTDAAVHGSASMPLSDYRVHIASGAITLLP